MKNLKLFFIIGIINTNIKIDAMNLPVEVAPIRTKWTAGDYIYKAISLFLQIGNCVLVIKGINYLDGRIDDHFDTLEKKLNK